MKHALSLLAAAFLAAAGACGSSTPGDGTGGAGNAASNGAGGADPPNVCDVACEDVPTFDELSWSKCVSCHAADPAVRQAEGVPADSDFTRYEGVARYVEKVAFLVSSTSTPMPPAGEPPLTVREKADFTAWSCCGGPQ